MRAALRFLSIGKARAAIKCFVSAGSFREALALIHSRLGPRDPLLQKTLLVYAAQLEKQHRYGEAAQTLLEVGTASAASRAVVVLVKTGEFSAFETALDVLAALECQRRSVGNGVDSVAAVAAEDSDWSVPSSTVFEIIRKALLSGHFSLSERASAFIGTGAARSSAPSASTRLTRCFLGVLTALTSLEFASKTNLDVQEHGDDTGEPDHDGALPSWPADFPAETQAFLSYLTQSSKRGYSDDQLWLEVGTPRMSSDPAHLRARSKRVWDAIFAVCRANGIWVGEAFEDNVMAAQELVMDKRYFANLVQPATSTVKAAAGGSGHDSGSSEQHRSLAVAMDVSHCLLQFLLDLMCGYLLSALERVRETFEAFTRSESGAAVGVADPNAATRVGDQRLQLMSLFFPSGLVDPESPPRIGELAVEAHDTSVLWCSLLLLQCRTLVSVARAHHSDIDHSSSLKRLLEEELVTSSEEATPDEANAALREQVRAEIQEVLAFDTSSGNGTELLTPEGDADSSESTSNA